LLRRRAPLRTAVPPRGEDPERTADRYRAVVAMQVISADEHLVESFEFWDDWLPSALPPRWRDRAPKRLGPGVALDGTTVMRTFTLFPDLVDVSDSAPGATDLATRAEVHAAHGIDRAVVYPQRAMAMWGIDDHDLRDACFDAYNSWLAEQCRQSQGHLVGVPILSTVHRPERTPDAIDRLRELGFHTMMLPNYPRGAAYGTPDMAPLFAAIEASGLPLSFHISEAPDGNGPGELGSYLMQSFQPFRKLWSYLVFAGIFDRHPALRVVFAEGGISWIPSALDHADRIAREFHAHLSPTLAHTPSHYWHTHCWATFMDDPRGLDQLEHIGADRVLWSSDYPHPEGTGERTAAVLADLDRRFGHDVAAAISGGTARAVYGLS
jgi:predicted TIM-barrel fold metal-dependent hydrolase